MGDTGKANVRLREFYKGKNIFITGGSGFLGICLLEKILRCVPHHGTIYLLLRPKKGKDIAERLEEIRKNQIFETVLQERSVEEVFEKVKAVAGDVSQDELGLSPTDRKMLIDNVNVIIHSAATLDFGDTLKTTVDINLLGTRRITDLAKACSKLAVLVHVSSAYVNSWRLHAEEVIYPLPNKMDAEELIGLVKKLSPEELEKQTPDILGEHPNTYTITKHLAEIEVQKVEKLFPCTIVRPSMIVGAWKEPVAGWTISKNGPQGFFMGASKGVIRRLPVASRLIYDYIPVDIVVNNMLAAGYYAGFFFISGVTKPQNVTIFHATTSTRNPFRWYSVEDRLNDYLHMFPLQSAIWYPYLKLLPSVTWYKISSFFVHILPAILLDMVLRVTGGRPILMKLHRNVNTSLDRLEKFIFTEWKFVARKLWICRDWMVGDDQNTFTVEVATLIWHDYFKDLTRGARIYLSKDPIKTLKSARTKDQM
nr:unnamed protein product [Callosobruchus chinensis]